MKALFISCRSLETLFSPNEYAFGKDDVAGTINAKYLEVDNSGHKSSLSAHFFDASKRVGISVIGLEVPHVHVHLIPLNSMDDARFIDKAKLDKEEFEAIAKAINSNL